MCQDADRTNEGCARYSSVCRQEAAQANSEVRNPRSTKIVIIREHRHSNRDSKCVGPKVLKGGGDDHEWVRLTKWSLLLALPVFYTE